MKENAVSRITEALSLLGNSEDEVAQSLRALEITGGNRCISCPIYNYLFDKFGPLKVAFDFEEESTWYDLVSMRRYSSSNPILPLIQRFIAKYDNGCYPFLRDP